MVLEALGEAIGISLKRSASLKRSISLVIATFIEY